MYQFDEMIDRKGKSMKWDALPYSIGDAQLTPMWVADMDFATPDCVKNAIIARLEHPTFGYFSPDARFYDAIIGWAKKRHGIDTWSPDQITYQNSTLGGLASALKVLTKPGDKILVHTPNYPGFERTILDSEREFLASPLIEEGYGHYRFDFADMERHFQSGVRCIVLCSPHNPTGRVWTRQELLALSSLCEKYGVAIISDEIWADFLLNNTPHLPFASVSDYAKENTIALYGATKTFNLAGLRIAYSVCQNKELNRDYRARCNASHYNGANTLSVEALIGAYTEGESYVDALLDYIRANMELATTYIRDNCPNLSCYIPEGTYVLWVKMLGDAPSDEEAMLRMSRLGLVADPCDKYHGSRHFRLNLACPRSQLETALDKMKAALC